MEISLPLSTELISTNVVDNTDIYDKTKRIVYAFDSELKDSTDAKKVYKRVGDSITPPLYDAGNEGTYKVNDVLFKDSVIQKVVSVGTSIELKQPWDYTNIDSGFAFNSWSYRYVKLLSGLSSPEFTHVTEDVTHKLRQAGSGWEYSITWESGSGTGWSNDIYEIGDYNGSPYYKEAFVYQETKDTNGNVTSRYLTLYVNGNGESHTVSSEPTTGYIVVSSANGDKRYKIGTLEESSYSGNDKTLAYAYQVEQDTTVYETQTETSVNVYSSLSPETVERSAYAYGSGADANSQWLGRTFIFNNATGDLYMRTQISIDSEYSETSTPVFNVVESISEFPGYVFYRATRDMIVFDGERYTYVIASGEITYKIGVFGRFDTVAFAGVIAYSIDVKFIDENGATIDSVIGYMPDNSIDDNGNLPDSQTTCVIYAKQFIPDGGSIEVSVKGAIIRLGTLMAGASTNAGFTNLTFSNEFVDYSPTEKDQWGNVKYVEGYKANIYSGTADIYIDNYDKITRLMTSLGAKEVILNGSSSKNNRQPDSRCVFSSTMVIGRLSGFRLDTQLDGELMGQMATYSFKIEESV